MGEVQKGDWEGGKGGKAAKEGVVPFPLPLLFFSTSFSLPLRPECPRMDLEWFCNIFCQHFPSNNFVTVEPDVMAKNISVEKCSLHLKEHGLKILCNKFHSEVEKLL